MVNSLEKIVVKNS